MSDVEGQPVDTGASGSVPENNVPDAVGRDETADFVLDAFTNMQQDYDEDDGMAVEPTAPAAPEQNSPAGTQPAGNGAAQAASQAAPQAAPTPPGPAVPPGGEGAQPQVPPTGASQQPSAEVSPDQVWSRLTGMIEQNRQAFTEALAQKSYSLSEAELEEFQVNPSKVIANIAARVQVQTTESLMKVMNQQLPIYMNGLMQVQQKSAEAENRFWGANPGLNRGEHAEVVKAIAQWYRSQNPNGDEGDFIKTVGNMAMARLGLVHSAVQQAAATQQQTAHTQQPPAYVVGTPGRVVRAVQPPAPVPGMHGAPPSSHPAPQLNEWDRLARMMETYDGD